MKISRSRTLAVSTALAMLAIGVHEATAQNLFQRLIQNNQHGRVQSVQPAQPAQVAEPAQQSTAPAAPAPRVSGPSYYAYKTDALVRVDFAGITPRPADDFTELEPTELDRTSVGSTEASEIVVEAADDNVLDAAASAIEEAVAAEEESEAAASKQAADDTVASQTTGEVPDAEVAAQSGESEAETAVEAQSSAVPAVEAVEEAATPAPRQLLTSTQVEGLQAFELMAEKEAAEAIAAYYSAEPELIWVADGKPNERAEEVLRVFADAGSHGLDPREYAVTLPRAGADAAAFEMELSARLLRYARDAQSGRIDPNRISGYHDFAAKELDRVSVLRGAADSDDVAEFLQSFHPANAQYAALRAELAGLRVTEGDEIVIAPGTLIKPGETNPEFSKILSLIDGWADPAMQAEYGELLARHLGTNVYTQELVPLIKAAQKLRGLGTDGVIGPRTVHALAGDTVAGRIEKVLVAMEQARWLPSDLTDRHVFINTPAFEVSYVEGGEEKLSMRTVVGTTRTQTYFFQDEIQYVEFHPYWGMPRSILVNTYLQRVINDPTYLDRNGFEVTDRRGQRVSSSSINWSQYGANIPYDVRQRPGRGNALGEMKIMFPNSHAIYMHDTPDKQLFDRDNRALSNGCIRLQDPRAMAAAVLGWSREDVAARLEQPHSRENLSVKVPVYVAYFTAWPDANGQVHYYEDVYSRDAKSREALDKVAALRSTGV